MMALPNVMVPNTQPSVSIVCLLLLLCAIAPILPLTGDSALPVRPWQAEHIMRNSVRPFLIDSSVAGIGSTRFLASSRLATSVGIPWIGMERAGKGVITPSCGVMLG